MRRVPIAGIILVVCISYASSEKYTSIDHYSMKNSTNETNCTSEGYMCRNCGEVVYCEIGANGSFIERYAGECSSDRTCLDGSCTADYNPACPPPPPPETNCTSEGYMCRNCGEVVYCEIGANGSFIERYAGECSSDRTCLDGSCTADYNPACPPPPPPETNCTSEGYMCRNCGEVVYCEIGANGSFIERYAGECSSNHTCLDGSCTADYNPACSPPPPEEKVDFMCRTPGLYPDPYECTTFHYCARSKDSNRTLIKLTDTCDCDYAYNARTSFCDLPLYNGTCYGYPAPECTSKGQTAAWFANPRLYYICALHPNIPVLYPFMYACEHGKIYDENEYLCKEM